MYHVELRQFPHNFCRFNLTEQQLREAVLDAWAQGKWIEFGERKWNPHQAHLTVIEGPQLPLDQLSMGRGWRTAAREGQDVTERLLVAARAEIGASHEVGRKAIGATSFAGTESWRRTTSRESLPDTPPADASAPDMRLLADSLGLDILSELGEESVSLAFVWGLARERHPEWTASDSLRLAEHAVRSLTGSQLAVVLVIGDGGKLKPCSSGEQVDATLHSIDSWSSTSSPASAAIRRV
jgi:hypothetical protein